MLEKNPFVRTKSKWVLAIPTEPDVDDLHQSFTHMIDATVERDDLELSRNRIEAIKAQVDALVAPLMWIETDLPGEYEEIDVEMVRKIKGNIDRLDDLLTVDDLVQVCAQHLALSLERMNSA